MEWILRPWRFADAEAIVPYADDPQVAANLRDIFPHPYTLGDAEAYLRLCAEEEGKRQLCRAIVVDGRAAGCVSLTRGGDVYRKSAELGYWLGRPFWRRGIMKEAVAQICQEGFAAWDIVRIYAEPYAKNLGSRGVLEKNGFVLEGTLRRSVYKNGELLDSCIYGKLRDEV